MSSMLIRTFVLALLCSTSQILLAFDESRIKGVRPASLQYLESFDLNQDSIIQALWAPAIDQGYVMQGLTLADDFLLISAYKSTDPAFDLGDSGVFQIDPQTGVVAGYFDLPKDVRHAGGLAYLGDGHLVVSDTYRLYSIDLYQALADQNSEQAVKGKLILRGRLKGSGLGFDGEYLVTIRYNSINSARAYFLSPALFTSHNRQQITEAQSARYISLPSKAQGAAFSQNGDMWVSFSNSNSGRVAQVDSDTGEIINSYDLVAGLEDIGFSSDGSLWAMSESGALRLSGWETQFPVIFSLDVYRMLPELSDNSEYAED